MAALVAAYPQALSGFAGRTLRWRDGSVSEIGEDTIQPYAQMLRNASLFDQLRLRYPPGPLQAPPSLNQDPGRFRNTAFFRKMYGNCWRGEVQKHLVPVTWLPNSWGGTIRATSINGVAQKLAAISDEIERLDEPVRRAAYPPAGAYACRPVVDTGQPSMHAYGAAIDLNFAFSDYWYWQRAGGAIGYRNRMPAQLVEIFERHGFIWGGKWYHYDTMHFEYRPELIALKSR